MISLFDELSKKIRKEPKITSRSTARQDLGILWFSRRDSLGELWKAAEKSAAVMENSNGETLRAIFPAFERELPENFLMAGAQIGRPQ